MAAEVEKLGPNIRVQIHNNLVESMEVDDDKQSENEEGEISDECEMETVKVAPKSIQNEVASNQNKLWPNPKGTFATGINIFDKDEQDKLQKRAMRFALNPDEICTFTDEDLQELHDSLGIAEDNEKNVRFNAIHMLGTDEMSTEDVLEYFQKYAPTGIEWVTDECCNVIWTENISAARAMHFTSKVVNGMPARGPCDPFAKEFMDIISDNEAEENGQSILLKNANRQVEMKEDEEVQPKKINFKNAVDIAEITIPIPPGYWRLGVPHSRSKCILLRFAFKTDKKPFKAEKFSKYYKKHGNPNFGGIKGIISETKKDLIRGIFDRNKEMNQEKNPWGSLAKNWSHDTKFCEREPTIIEEPKVEVKNPSLLVRLGKKRKPGDEPEEEPEEIIQEKKKVKIPRMRMYADEEEEKLKRKKILQTIKQQTEIISVEETRIRSDLRNTLRTSQKAINETMFLDEPVDQVDLGTKLKNRSRKMTFTVAREPEELEARKDIRALLDERRARSPVLRKKSPIRLSEIRRRRSPENSPRRRRSSPAARGRRRTPERSLHSDRLYSRDSDYSDEEASYKPKSKVAVVIKTQKKPTVASTIWSRVKKPSESEESSSESSESEDDGSKSSEESKSEEDEMVEDGEEEAVVVVQNVKRPGFKTGVKSRLSDKVEHRSPLKIEISNDHFKKT